MQVGSDGKTSCATCHFHAGADNRLEKINISWSDADQRRWHRKPRYGF
ncbi:hypothetical protein [Nostoc sp.]